MVNVAKFNAYQTNEINILINIHLKKNYGIPLLLKIARLFVLTTLSAEMKSPVQIMFLSKIQFHKHKINK